MDRVRVWRVSGAPDTGNIPGSEGPQDGRCWWTVVTRVHPGPHGSGAGLGDHGDEERWELSDGPADPTVGMLLLA